MAWSGFGGKRIWSGSKPVSKTHRTWFWQNATDPLAVSHFQDRYSIHPQMARTILSKTRPDPIWLWLTVSDLAKRIRSGNKPVCKNHLASASQPIRTGYESDTVYIYIYVYMPSWNLPRFYSYHAVTCAKVAGKVNFCAPYFFSAVHWRLYECGQTK